MRNTQFTFLAIDRFHRTHTARGAARFHSQRVDSAFGNPSEVELFATNALSQLAPESHNDILYGQIGEFLSITSEGVKFLAVEARRFKHEWTFSSRPYTAALYRITISPI